MEVKRVLYGRSAPSIQLAKALSSCSAHFSDVAIGLFYSPSACRIGKVCVGVVTDETDVVLDLTQVFEARIFNAQGELRWLNRSGGQGQAVLLAEQPIEQYLTEPIEPIQAIEVIDSQYLLWGEGTGSKPIAEHWSYLSAARIGKVAVPIDGVNRKDRVKLLFCEYLGEWDDQGNIVVLEERLIGLKRIIDIPI
jgi:CRISPR-associated protein (TIGR03984 family)